MIVFAIRLLFISLSIYFIARAMRALRSSWTIADVVPSFALALFPGKHRFTGAPLQNTDVSQERKLPCAWRRLDVYERIGNTYDFQRVSSDPTPIWIVLHDETGGVWVDTREVEVLFGLNDLRVDAEGITGYRHEHEREKRVEYVLQAGQPITIEGSAVLSPDGSHTMFTADPALGAPDDEPLKFTIFSRSIVATYFRATGLFTIAKYLALSTLFLSVGAFVAEGQGPDSSLELSFSAGRLGINIWLIPLGLGLIATGLWLKYAWDRLAINAGRAAMSWAQIDVELHRRNQLIPSLVETTKGYAAHESAVLSEIVRNVAAAPTLVTVSEGSTPNHDALVAASVVCDTQVKSAQSLTVLAESYADLVANEQYLHLQRELKRTEDRLAMTRDYYNLTIEKLRVLRSTIPYVFIRWLVPCPSYELWNPNIKARAKAPDPGVAPDLI